MFQTVQLIVKTYARAVVAQGVGTVGLLWCLYDDHPGFGAGLLALVLADQAIFLRTRFAAENRDVPFQAVLNGWCLLISGVDILVFFAILYRATGLADGHAVPATDPLDALAFSIATFARVGLDLHAQSGLGRLLAALQGLIGNAVLLGGAVVVALAWRRR